MINGWPRSRVESLKPVRTAAKALNALSAFSTAAEDKARERGEEVPAFTL